jgi:hypothetical protein
MYTILYYRRAGLISSGDRRVLVPAEKLGNCNLAAGPD